VASAVTNKPKFSIEDGEQKPQFTIEDEIPNIASEKEMAAHPPAAPKVEMHEIDSPSTRWRGMNRQLPRTPGSDEEAIREGSGPAVTGLSTIGMAGMPIEAIATRSLAPLMPLVRGAVGATAGASLGGYGGGEIGGIFGERETGHRIGATIGGAAGGFYGGIGGKVPTRLSILKSLLPAEEAAAVSEAAVPERLSPIKRAPEEIYQRPIAPAPGAGKGAAPSEMHPDELAAIRKEAGNPEMSPEDAHRFRINKTASAAASTKPANDLGGIPRAGEEPDRLQPVGEKARAPRGYFNLGRGSAGPTVEQVVNDAMGVKPLEPNVPLREQPPRSEVAPAVDPIKVKYPDPAVRQMVRANGEKIVEAVGKNPALMKQIHDLTRVELREALINAGEDMGQQTVSNSKFAGEGSIGRQEAFDRLLAKGHSPEKIVELAKQKPEGPSLEAEAGKPGLLVPPETSSASAQPTPPPSERWTADRGAMPGEPELFLDGDAENAKAVIVQREDPREPGRARWEVMDKLGESHGLFSTPEDAAKAAEKDFPKAETRSRMKVETIEEPKPSRLGAQRETRERAGRIKAARLNP